MALDIEGWNFKASSFSNISSGLGLNPSHSISVEAFPFVIDGDNFPGVFPTWDFDREDDTTYENAITGVNLNATQVSELVDKIETIKSYFRLPDDGYFVKAIDSGLGSHIISNESDATLLTTPTSVLADILPYSGEEVFKLATDTAHPYCSDGEVINMPTFNYGSWDEFEIAPKYEYQEYNCVSCLETHTYSSSYSFSNFSGLTNSIPSKFNEGLTTVPISYGVSDSASLFGIGGSQESFVETILQNRGDFEYTGTSGESFGSLFKLVDGASGFLDASDLEVPNSPFNNSVYLPSVMGKEIPDTIDIPYSGEYSDYKVVSSSESAASSISDLDLGFRHAYVAECSRQKNYFINYGTLVGSSGYVFCANYGYQLGYAPEGQEEDQYYQFNRGVHSSSHSMCYIGNSGSEPIFYTSASSVVELDGYIGEVDENDLKIYRYASTTLRSYSAEDKYFPESYIEHNTGAYDDYHVAYTDSVALGSPDDFYNNFKTAIVNGDADEWFDEDSNVLYLTTYISTFSSLYSFAEYGYEQLTTNLYVEPTPYGRNNSSCNTPASATDAFLDSIARLKTYIDVFTDIYTEFVNFTENKEYEPGYEEENEYGYLAETIGYRVTEFTKYSLCDVNYSKLDVDSFTSSFSDSFGYERFIDSNPIYSKVSDYYRYETAIDNYSNNDTSNECYSIYSSSYGTIHYFDHVEPPTVNIDNNINAHIQKAIMYINYDGFSFDYISSAANITNMSSPSYPYLAYRLYTGSSSTKKYYSGCGVSGSVLTRSESMYASSPINFDVTIPMYDCYYNYEVFFLDTSGSCTKYVGGGEFKSGIFPKPEYSFKGSYSNGNIYVCNITLVSFEYAPVVKTFWHYSDYSGHRFDYYNDLDFEDLEAGIGLPSNCYISSSKRLGISGAPMFRKFNSYEMACQALINYPTYGNYHFFASNYDLLASQDPVPGTSDKRETIILKGNNHSTYTTENDTYRQLNYEAVRYIPRLQKGSGKITVKGYNKKNNIMSSAENTRLIDYLANDPLYGTPCEGTYDEKYRKIVLSRIVAGNLYAIDCTYDITPTLDFNGHGLGSTYAHFNFNVNLDVHNDSKETLYSRSILNSSIIRCTAASASVAETDGNDMNMTLSDHIVPRVMNKIKLN
jgi:hypothetical protein